MLVKRLLTTANLTSCPDLHQTLGAKFISMEAELRQERLIDADHHRKWTNETKIRQHTCLTCYLVILSFPSFVKNKSIRFVQTLPILIIIIGKWERQIKKNSSTHCTYTVTSPIGDLYVAHTV